jgi:hypothetical protein
MRVVLTTAATLQIIFGRSISPFVLHCVKEEEDASHFLSRNYQTCGFHYILYIKLQRMEFYDDQLMILINIVVIIH